MCQISLSGIHYKYSTHKHQNTVKIKDASKICIVLNDQPGVLELVDQFDEQKADRF